MVAIFGVADIEQHSLAELEHDGIFNINNSSQVTTEDPQSNNNSSYIQISPLTYKMVA